MDVKYKLHLCYRHQKQYREALSVVSVGGCCRGVLVNTVSW